MTKLTVQILRNLFGKPKNTDKWLEQGIKENQAEMANKWNFDFSNERPFKANG